MTPAPPTANPRQAFLQQLVTGVNATNQPYREHPSLFPSDKDINFQPIPYFGDPLIAEFATFAVNPAAAELTWDRWPEANLTVQQLDSRLVGYFTNSEVARNSWFDGYEKQSGSLGPDMALNILGAHTEPIPFTWTSRPDQPYHERQQLRN